MYCGYGPSGFDFEAEWLENEKWRIVEGGDIMTPEEAYRDEFFYVGPV